MNFTEEEKSKIISNMILIRDWLDERKDCLRNMIRVGIKYNNYVMDFVVTNKRSYLSIGKSLYGFETDTYNLLNKKNSEVAYFVIANWPKIKAEVERVLKLQEEINITIMEFKI